ncbi:MAG: hypothetical protein EXS31_11930 [Pedosphaera sp.]|nr:hypothetical protein [Pedosphaera sp.]
MRADTAGEVVVFDQQYDLKNSSAQDAIASESKALSGRVLHMVTGQQPQWPGISLRAPGGHWNLSPHEQVAVTLRKTGTKDMRVNCHVARAAGVRQIRRLGEPLALWLRIRNEQRASLILSLITLRGKAADD